MRQWVTKLIQQLDDNFLKPGEGENASSDPVHISEDRATLLYILDVYGKHLLEIDKHPTRKVREAMDEFSRELVKPDMPVEKTLFRLRQFFSSYRVDEYSYVKKTFDDFKMIIWDFLDQLGEDFKAEVAEDAPLTQRLQQLREAVEADSIEDLRSKSREFIDSYMEKQFRREERRNRRMDSLRQGLDTVKKKLVEAHQDMMIDHLSKAFNRKSFDEKIKQHAKLFEVSRTPVCVAILDIDHFKKVNDTYGHDVGDFVIQECVRLLKETFHQESDFVARIGGEEFAVILPEHGVEPAMARLEAFMAQVRKEVIVQRDQQIRFTVSVGLAPLCQGEAIDQWLKRADSALYASKQGGRNRITLAPGPGQIKAA